MNEERISLTEEAKVTAWLVGRTITVVNYYDDNPTCDWAGHETLDIVLDDGREIRVEGWGHDAWGITVSDVTNE